MAEKRTIELEIKDNSPTLKQQYKEAVIELQKMASAYGETSKEAVEAAKKAASLKDQIEDTNDLLKSYKGEGAFIAMGKALSSVASGFSAVQGGLGLLGVESESVEKTMLKVQSAMALAQGLEGLEDAGRAFKQMGVVAKTALSGIKSGVAATGIGLLVIALGAIVAYWDDIKEAVSGVNAETKQQLEDAKKRVTYANTELELFDLQRNALKLQGKSEKEILQQRELRLNKLIKEQEAELNKAEQNKKLEIDASKRNQEIAKIVINAYVMGLSYLVTMFTGLFDGISNGIVFLAKKLNSFQQSFQNVMIDALVFPIETALKGVNELLKLTGQGTINVKGIIGDIKSGAKELQNVGNKIIQGLEGTNFTQQIWTFLDKNVSDPLSKMVFDPASVAKESDATILELRKGLEKTKSELAGGQIAIQDINKKAVDESNKNKEEAQKNAKEKEIEYRKKTIENLEKQYEDESKLLSESEKAKIDLIKNSKEKQKSTLINDYNSWEKSFLDERTQDEKKALDEQYENGLISEEQYRKDLAEIRKNAIELLSEQEKGILTDKKTKLYDELKIIDEQKQKELNDALTKLRQDNSLVELTEQQKQIELINQKYKSIEELAQGNANAEKEITELKNKEIDAINKKYADEDKKRRKANIDKGLDLARTQFQSLGDLATAFNGKSKKQQKIAFDIKKAADIGSATIDTYKSAQAAYASLAGIPIVGPVLGGIAAGVAVGTGLFNVKKIASQKFEGGGDSGGGGGGGGAEMGGGGASGAVASQAPSFNVVGNNGLNQLAQLQQQPTQAFVVSGDVTSAQSLERNRIQNATL